MKVGGLRISLFLDLFSSDTIIVMSNYLKGQEDIVLYVNPLMEFRIDSNIPDYFIV